MDLQQVAQATLALLVDEVLALGEVGAAELWAGHGPALWHRHSLAIQLQLSVLGRVWLCVASGNDTVEARGGRLRPELSVVMWCSLPSATSPRNM